MGRSRHRIKSTSELFPEPEGRVIATDSTATIENAASSECVHDAAVMPAYSCVTCLSAITAQSSRASRLHHPIGPVCTFASSHSYLPFPLQQRCRLNPRSTRWEQRLPSPHPTSTETPAAALKDAGRVAVRRKFSSLIARGRGRADNKPRLPRPPARTPTPPAKTSPSTAPAIDRAPSSAQNPAAVPAHSPNNVHQAHLTATVRRNQLRTAPYISACVRSTIFDSPFDQLSYRLEHASPATPVAGRAHGGLNTRSASRNLHFNHTRPHACPVP